jgi:putative flippase GtrA
MIKKTLAYLWSLRRQFAKYFITGVSAVIIDMGSLIFLKEIMGITPIIAVIINQVFIVIFVFLLNKYWSFRNKAWSHSQVVRFLTVVIFDYFFAVGAMYIFNGKLGFDYRLVRLASIALAVSWNFFLYKYWVYVQKPEAVQPLENQQISS